MTATTCETVPLVALTVTLKEPAKFAGTLTVSAEAPEGGSARLVGLSAAVGPVVKTVAVRETEPLNPANGVTVIVDVPDEPEAMLRYIGLAATAKSATPVILPMKVDQQ